MGSVGGREENKESMNHYSLIPRPHPFTKRNDLVNQVNFFGLPHTFVTVSPSNFFIPNLLKNVRILKQRLKILTVAKEVIIINLAISLLFGNKPKKFTRPFLARNHAWSGHETRITSSGVKFKIRPEESY